MSAVGGRRDGQRRCAHACEARPAEAPVRGLSPAVVLDFSFSPWTNPWRRTLGPPVGRCPGRPASVRPRVLRFASTIFQGARGASRRFLAPGSLHPGDLGVGGRGRRIREARRPSRCALGGGVCSQGLPPPAMAPETGTPKVQPGCAALSTLYLASDVSALFPSYEQSASGWGWLQRVGGASPHPSPAPGCTRRRFSAPRTAPHGRPRPGGPGGGRPGGAGAQPPAPFVTHSLAAGASRAFLESGVRACRCWKVPSIVSRRGPSAVWGPFLQTVCPSNGDTARPVAAAPGSPAKRRLPAA